VHTPTPVSAVFLEQGVAQYFCIIYTAVEVSTLFMIAVALQTRTAVPTHTM